MAYTPVGWQTGDTITADRLNKMDNGWGVESTQLFSETVTTVDKGDYNSGSLTFSRSIDIDAITVTFDGTAYECQRLDDAGNYYYGGGDSQNLDFSVYPFLIESTSGDFNTIYTETAGTYTVSVATNSVETSEGFASAVAAATGPMPFLVTEWETTWQELYDAVAAGRIAYIPSEDSGNVYVYLILAVTSGESYGATSVGVYDGAVSIVNYGADSANDPIYSI